MSTLRAEITRTLQQLGQQLGRKIASHSGLPPVIQFRDTAQKPVPPGSAFGHYRIQRRLGAGGMGQVYLATDMRLDRRVALKFLSPEIASDAGMLLRLQAEARTASSLNHPNILTIYEVGQFDDRHYIASEFIEGQTLRSLLQAKVLPAAEVIDIACQVASALIAAHQAGIIHRDLKPGNIMIRPDGYVKVIDFGLAKRTRTGDKSVPSASLTRPGYILGTVYYMSPEQARGDAVDHRTDIWSLGIILFEMLARRRPFEGRTESHILVQILDHPLPDMAGLGLLPELVSVLHRSLAKVPAERYQSAREMLGDLTAVPLAPAVSSRPAGRPLAPARRGLRLSSWFRLAAVILLLIAAFAFVVRRDRLFAPPPLQLELVRQLTFSGQVDTQRISPDGRYLAYVTGTADGFETLYLKQIGTGAEQKRLPPQQTRYAGLTFSPDSQSLYLVRKDDRELGRLYSLPLLGDTQPHLLLVDIDGPVSFSPDGSEFSFIRYQQNSPGSGKAAPNLLMVARADGSDVRRRFAGINDDLMRRTAWSPDGEDIAVLAGQANDILNLHLVGRQGERRHFSFPRWRHPSQPLWLPDARSLLLTAEEGIENQSQIYSIDVRTGRATKVTHDISAYKDLSASSDGSTVTAIRSQSQARVWVSEPDDPHTGTSFGAENESYPSLSWLDGGHLVVNARRERYPNLWVLDIDSQGREPLTEEPAVEQSAAAIPNSRSVILVSNRSGDFHLWRFDAQANNYQQLTFGNTFDERPAVSPDGQWVYYTAWEGNLPHLRRVRTSGGPSKPVGSFMAKDVRVSPEGTRLLCLARNEQTQIWSTAVVDAEGQSAPITISRARALSRWSPDGQSITTVITDRRNVSNLWQVPLQEQAPRQISKFEDAAITDFAWSPDGRRVACLRVSQGSDAVLFNMRPRP